jgi:ribosomal protein S27E
MMSALSNVVTIFASFLLSAVVTRHYSQISTERELGRLAEAAASRIYLLSIQMREVVDDLQGLDVVDERETQFIESVAAQIDRLSAQADLSVEDLQRIADVDLSLPALRDEAQTRVEAASKRESVPCPHCGERHDVLMSTKGGTSKHSRCEETRRGFVVHRLNDGSLKVSHTGYFRIDCPNQECGNEIGVRRRDGEWGVIVRNCFNCFARIQYNLDSEEIDSWEVETPMEVPLSSVRAEGDVRKVQCPDCGYDLTLQGFTNSRGEEVISCSRCTKLLRVKDGAPRPAG